MSYYSVAEALKNYKIDALQNNNAVAKEKKSAAKPVIGTSTLNSSIKSVNTYRSVDIFVSRLHSLTSSEKIMDLVDSVKGDLSVQNVVCEKLNSRFEYLYSSYHVAIGSC